MANENSPSDSRLWEELQRHARENEQSPVKTILIFNADGGGRQLYPDGRREEWWGQVPTDPNLFPPAAGWGFACGQVSFNGKCFRLGGIRYRLLRVLAERPGHPVPDRLVKLRVWGETDVEDDRLKDAVYQLRAVLRTALAIEDDPVERWEGGYRLALV